LKQTVQSRYNQTVAGCSLAVGGGWIETTWSRVFETMPKSKSRTPGKKHQATQRSIQFIRDLKDAIELVRAGKAEFETAAYVATSGPNTGLLLPYKANGAIPVNGAKFVADLERVCVSVQHSRTKGGYYFIELMEKSPGHPEIPFTWQVFLALRFMGYTEIQCTTHACNHDGRMVLGSGPKHPCANYEACLDEFVKSLWTGQQGHCPVECSRFVPERRAELDPWVNDNPPLDMYV
jgi:hypothetical protein